MRALTRAGSSARAAAPRAGTLTEALAAPAGAVSFSCPIDLCLLENGRAYGSRRWNPATETALSILQGARDAYEGSILARYYATWQPPDAASAVIGLPRSARGLRTLPAHGFYVVPWRNASPADVLSDAERWHARDLLEHGHRLLGIERVGFNGHGPVSVALGRAEYGRISRLVRSIAQHGFVHDAGAAGDSGIRVEVLWRGQEPRFIIRGGLHRTAVLDAYGHSHVPATLYTTKAADVADAADWPQVRSGLWTRDEAARYVDHLFDFDSRHWAAARGLCAKGAAPAQPRHLSLALRHD